MIISLILAAIFALFTFFVFTGGTSDVSFFERLVYSFILFAVSFGLFEIFRYTWDWMKDVFKK